MFALKLARTRSTATGAPGARAPPRGDNRPLLERYAGIRDAWVTASRQECADSSTGAARRAPRCGGALRGRGAGPAVGVLEAHDVLQLRGRDLEDRGVLDRRHAMDGSGWVMERGAGPDD